MPSCARVGAGVHGQSQAMIAPGSESAFTSSEGRRFYSEDAAGRRLVVMNPDPPSSLSSSTSSSFGRSRRKSRNRAHAHIEQRTEYFMTALSRLNPAFHARNYPHPRDSTASETTYSLRKIPEDDPIPTSSSSSSSSSIPSSSSALMFSPQSRAQLQMQAPSTSYTSMPLPSNNTTRKRIVIHLSNHEPGPRIVPQRNGVFIRTKYAVEIANVQIDSGSCLDNNHYSSSSMSSSVSSASASGSRSSGISGRSGSTSTSSPSTESDRTATNEIAGLDISKVKPAYFYRVLRAGTVAMQRRSASRGDSALRRRRSRANELDTG
ncbi:hypothetical protein BDW75DRAFT_230238 [Aspergillus navahoensis]